MKLLRAKVTIPPDLVRGFQQALGDLKQDVWIDSRELRGGDLLWPEIQNAIEQASAYAVVVSTDALQSKWVGKELRHALDVQKQRGKDRFPVIPLSLNGTKLGVLEGFFGEEPLYIPVSSAAGRIDAALNAVLVAMGKRLPADVPVAAQPKAEPLEELNPITARCSTRPAARAACSCSRATSSSTRAATRRRRSSSMARRRTATPSASPR